MVPAVGRNRPATRRSNVDLPQPEAPTTATNSPWRTSRSMSSSASTRFWPSSKLLRTPFSDMAGATSASMKTSGSLISVCVELVDRCRLRQRAILDERVLRRVPILVDHDAKRLAFGGRRGIRILGKLHLPQQRLAVARLIGQTLDQQVDRLRGIGERERMRVARDAYECLGGIGVLPRPVDVRGEALAHQLHPKIAEQEIVEF